MNFFSKILNPFKRKKKKKLNFVNPGFPVLKLSDGGVRKATKEDLERVERYKKEQGIKD